MKKAWIYKEDCPVTNKVTGQIERVTPVDEEWKIFLASYLTTVEFDETLIDENYLTTVNTEGVWSVVEDTATKTAADKAQQVADAYATMNSEVYAEMASVFGTTNADSATAYELTWKLMKENPASYINVGIKDGNGVEFTLEADVVSYADTKLAASLAYSVWRMQRIEQFRTLRASILGE